MRVLLTSHLPLRRGSAGKELDRLRKCLSVGHEVRTVMCVPSADVPDGVRGVVCSVDDPAADLPFDLPVLDGDPAARPHFSALSHAQFAAYREAFRAAIDAEIESFDPQIVHVQHLWIDGHLILESGAPYVATAYASELAAAKADRRFVRYVQETAENAGRIQVGDAHTQWQLAQRFDLPTDRFIRPDLSVGALTMVYQSVNDARFGRR